VAAHPAWRTETAGRTVTVFAADGEADDALSIVRSTARAVWDAAPAGETVTVAAGDDTARAALERWSLLTVADRLA
jgi:hypothetical protein